MTVGAAKYTGELLRASAINAVADYSGSDSNGLFQFRAFVVDTNEGKAVLAGANAKRIFGILQNAPRLNEACQLGMMGVMPAQAGAAVAAGDLLETDGNGNLITATSGQNVVGIALEPANAAKVIFTVFIFPFMGTA